MKTKFLGFFVSWFVGFLVSWFLGFLVTWVSWFNFLVSWSLSFRFLGFLVSSFLGFLVSWLLGVLVPWFLGFKVSKMQRTFNVFWKIMIPHYTSSISCFRKTIDPILPTFHFVLLRRYWSHIQYF